MKPDRLVAVMRAEQTDAAASTAQTRVNAKTAEALAAARQVGGVTAATEQYSVWQKGDGKTQPLAWQATQSIRFYTADGPALLALVGSLQEKGLAVSQLGWELAPETARNAEREATLRAVKALRGRADEIAGAIDLQFSSFREVTVGQQPRPAPVRARMAAAAPMVAPVEPSAADENVEVSATVQAGIELKPR